MFNGSTVHKGYETGTWQRGGGEGVSTADVVSLIPVTAGKALTNTDQSALAVSLLLVSVQHLIHRQSKTPNRPKFRAKTNESTRWTKIR